MRGTTVGEINTMFNQRNFASSVRKETSVVDALMYVKNYIWVLKILDSTFLDQSPQKLDVFVLNLQYILILQDVGQDKTK